MKRLILFATLALSSAAAHAQVGVYAGYTATKLDVSNTNWVYGPTFGAYYNFTHLPVINFGVDARVSFTASSNTTKITGGLIGPRAVVKVPAIPIRPYAELLAGVAKAQYGPSSSFSNETDFALGFSAGVDLRILPYLDWRVLDYTFARLQNIDGSYQKSLTTGLVLRIPHA